MRKGGEGDSDLDACPQVEELAAYIDRGLSQGEEKDIEYHLVRCERCRHLVAVVIKSQSSVPDPPKPRL